MKLATTIFSNNKELPFFEIMTDSIFCYCSKNVSGLVIEIKDDDDWLDGELAWVSKSEIPFITAFRLSQVSSDIDGSIWGTNLNPVITKYGRDHGVFFLSKQKEYSSFPSRDECINFLKRENKNNIKYEKKDLEINKNEIKRIIKSFDYSNDLQIKTATALHKAHTLENTSYMFAEEIYINIFIAFEGIIEILKKKKKKSRKEIIKIIAKVKGNNSFVELEEEMRDQIRNNIIHPWRDKYKETVLQPMHDVDFIFEDLPLIDWLFKQVILNKI